MLRFPHVFNDLMQDPMHVPELTEAFIREHTTPGSYERGREYYENGVVQHLEYSAREINARVKGSYYVPYAVHVSFDAQGITEVECTCPFHEGSWCKHIAATLFAILNEDADAPSHETVETRLEALSREQLIALIERLIALDSTVADRVKRRLDELET